MQKAIGIWSQILWGKKKVRTQIYDLAISLELYECHRYSIKLRKWLEHFDNYTWNKILNSDAYKIWYESASAEVAVNVDVGTCMTSDQSAQRKNGKCPSSFPGEACIVHSHDPSCYLYVQIVKIIKIEFCNTTKLAKNSSSVIKWDLNIFIIFSSWIHTFPLSIRTFRRKTPW